MARGEAGRAVMAEKVFRREDYPLYLFLSLVQVAALAVFLLFWFSLPFDFISVVLTLLLLYGLSSYLLGWLSLPLMRNPRPMAPREGWKVAVVTSFVPGAEPFEMLEETVRALVALEYPHETWVLDEGDDERVKALCAALGAWHFSRKHLPQYQQESGPFRARTKHGNYNAWLEEVGFERYDIVAGFDPDHVPEPHYLLEVLGYYDDPQVGYVQAPQIYYNEDASFIARGAAEESYAFYAITQRVSFGAGGPTIIGSHYTHRVRALWQVGGFPAHDAEDLLLTLRYQAAGWRGVYVPKILAQGLAPVDWASYLAQQLRWARAVLDIKFRQFPRLARQLPLRERFLSFLHGIYYLRPLWIFAVTLLLVYLLASGASTPVVSYRTAAYLLLPLAATALADLYRRRFYLAAHSRSGLPWRARLLSLGKWPVLLRALLQSIRGQEHAYVLTPKVRGSRQRSLLAPPHLLVVVALCGAWIYGYLAGHVLHPLVQVAAGGMVLLSLVLVWSETRRASAPYDRTLRKQQRDSPPVQV